MSLETLSQVSRSKVSDGGNANDSVSPKIEFDEHSSVMRVCDARLFHAESRGFGRRLLEEICKRKGVKKASIVLEASTCRIDFEEDPKTPQAMANLFVQAIQAASEASKKKPWWRRPGRWSSLTAYRSEAGSSLWETYSNGPDSVKLVRRGVPKSHPAALDLAEAAAGVEGVRQCKISAWNPQMTILCQNDGANNTLTLDRLESIRELKSTSAPTDRDSIIAEGQPTPLLAHGLKRLRYGALAAGSFIMSVVGLVVPGIPTVPFLLATSYYLARSSPKLDERLRRTAFFGPILTEWETRGALSRHSKGKLVGMTVVIVAATLAFTAASPIAMVVILFVALISVLGILRMPEFSEDGTGTGRSGLAGPAFAAT